MRTILGIILAGFVSAAHAQTPTEIRACYWDSVHLCGVKPGTTEFSFFERLRIQGCMLYHRNDVTPRCRVVFAAHGL